MTGIKPICVPKTVSQVIAGFAGNDKNQKSGADVSKMRRALRTGSDALVSNTPVSVVDSMKLYSMALKKQRKASGETALEKKKLKYSFKKISSKIISSKTSTAAREAVAQAKREIQKLKAARRTGKYDEEELEAALDHAKSMERIARKKVRHLEEEEMAERCSSSSEKDGAPATDCEEAETKDPVQKEIDSIREELSEVGKKAENEEYIESEEITCEMISDITEGMEEMLEAIEELNDLMNELVSAPSDMKPEDIDAMKIKHRNKEMKDITKADSEYLKAVFDHYEKEISGGAMPVTAGSAPTVDVAL
ncbi:MAG: hypothetical protein K6E49_01390 [Lachnospiraceae bacterium]|nr:hypothetical protein [Lachnospiraceae bacterium]